MMRLATWVTAFPSLYGAMCLTELGATPGGNPMHHESSLWAHAVLAAHATRGSPLAALLHDVGKIATGVTHEGRKRFPGHAVVGGLMVLCMALARPDVVPAGGSVATLVAFHMDLTRALPKKVWAARYPTRSLLDDVRCVAMADLEGRIGVEAPIRRRARHAHTNARKHYSTTAPVLPIHLVLYAGTTFPAVKVRTGALYTHEVHLGTPAVDSLYTTRYATATVVLPPYFYTWVTTGRGELPAGARQMPWPLAESIHALVDPDWDPPREPPPPYATRSTTWGEGPWGSDANWRARPPPGGP